MERPASQPYSWKSVQIVGGGFVDGIIFHPTAHDVCYCRTDMGGAYRRNINTMRWEPLLDWLSYEDRNLMGVESIAVDPSDPDRVYLACGTYTLPQVPNGAILRSSDRGSTFQRTDLPFKLGANENGRGNGERLAVDPNDGNILYMGTRIAGLWKSADQAVTWSRVVSFPDVAENPPAGMQAADSIRAWQWNEKGSGIIFVLFDGRTGTHGKASRTIYAGVSLMNRANLFRSTDAGESWHPVPGHPTQYRPTHGVLTTDGILYLTYGNSPGPSWMRDGGVWKYNTDTNEWTDVTPDKPDPGKKKSFGYAAVSVDSRQSNTVIVSSYLRPDFSGRDDIFRSTDGGKIWTTIFGNGGTLDFSLAPYVSHTPIHWLFDIEIDPANSNHALFTTGYGGFETFNLTDADKGKPTAWSVMSSGIEESVALELLSPPKGAPLISAIGDYCGFVHWDLDKPAPDGNFGNPRFGNTNGVACAENNPDVLVRVGMATYKYRGHNIGYSLDGGRTWQPAATMPDPESNLGHIAVSADGSAWVWASSPIVHYSSSGRTSDTIPVFFTLDNGATWTPCIGLPQGSRVIADRENPMKFYAMDLFKGLLYVSIDAGAHFTEQLFQLPGGLPRLSEERGDPRGGQDRLYTTPGMEGDLWIAAFDGLYHSTDSGVIFSRLNGVEEIHAFGFGRGKTEKSYPTIYLIGTISGIRGIYRSDDRAQTWVRINDRQHQWGMLFHITGDPKKYGRVYIGTHGRGIFYGDPNL
ncbi:MAG: exo-alpha-sialidase [Ignavibacteriae bacterium]|nr:MAG: exo-alpha-sialidase [Ignavibacteriota bacterium]